jgi:GNAT superfamily N-acetyltransferase
MESSDILALYDAQVRARPRAAPGLTLEQQDGVLLLTGSFNFVCRWDCPDRTAPRIVSQLTDRFRARGEGLMWDVYEHDQPARIGEYLAGASFVAEQTSTLMVLDLSTTVPAMPAGVEVRRVTDTAALRDFVRVAGEAFGKEDGWQFDAYADQLASKEDFLFNAYVDGAAAGSSRIEVTAGCAFAGLYGGAVSPAFQGRGLYRAMVAARAELAKALGVKYLSAGARETSRPILSSLGFTPATRFTRWVLPTA